MSGPRFSVVIPTRERGDTLPFTLQTCLAQDFDDYEIIVCDNCSTPAVQEAVTRSASPRVRYFRSDKPLSLPENWNLAISQARGEYVTIIGSDDGMMPYALRELDNLIIQTRAKALTWSLPIYIWPTAACPEEANYLVLPLERHISRIQSREQIRAVIRNKAWISTLPNIYHGLIHRSLIDALRERTGTVFTSQYPDTYSAVAFAYLAEWYAAISVPMTVNAFSATSSSGVFFTAKTNSSVYQEGMQAHHQAGIYTHPWVPNLPLMNVVMANSFLTAKESVFPTDDSLVLDRKRMASLYVSQLWTTELSERREAIGMIRKTLTDDPKLVAWFDATDPMSVPSVPPFRYRNWGLGYKENCLCLNADQFGVFDVAAATQLCARLLAYRVTEIKYDMPPRWEQSAKPSLVRRTLNRCLSCLPHRVVQKARKLLSERRASRVQDNSATEGPTFPA